jgi:hypothetical protein
MAPRKEMMIAPYATWIGSRMWSQCSAASWLNRKWLRKIDWLGHSVLMFQERKRVDSEVPRYGRVPARPSA